MSDGHNPIHGHFDPFGSSSAPSKLNSIQPAVAMTPGSVVSGFQPSDYGLRSTPGTMLRTSSQNSSNPRTDFLDFREYADIGSLSRDFQKLAHDYMGSIKDELGESSKIETEFRYIMDIHARRRITDAQMIHRVLDLFHAVPKLIEGFADSLRSHNIKINHTPTTIRLIDGRGREMYFYPGRTFSNICELLDRSRAPDSSGAQGTAVDERRHSEREINDSSPMMRIESEEQIPPVQKTQISTIAAAPTIAAICKERATPAHSQFSASAAQNKSNETTIRNINMRTASNEPHTRWPPSSQISDGQGRIARERRIGYPILFANSMDFVSHIKTRFAEQHDRYLEFIHIIREFGNGKTSKQQVAKSMNQLLRDEPDLLNQFNVLFPEAEVCDDTGNDDDMIQESPDPKRRRLSATESEPLPANEVLAGYRRSPTVVPSMDLERSSEREPSPMRDLSADHEPAYTAAEYPAYLPVIYPNSLLFQSQESAYESDSDSTESDDFPTSLITMEDIEMHRMVRKHINDHNRSYKDFLKLLTLYTNGIFDTDLIIKHSEPFIGDSPHLFQWLKSLLDYRLTANEEVNQPEILIPKPALHACETVKDSPSYHHVPRDWQQLPCSGRDDLCREVLNDEYVSQPRWNREDSDFPASKKNTFEDEMHDCEEARYSFDIVLDAFQTAIATLDLLIRSPPAEPVVLDAITRICINRIYGSQRSREIERLIQTHFIEVAPTVLERLRQKNKEWKQAQYELLPIWRERDANNYYRALDYMGNAFRTADRKATGLRALITSIQTLSEKGGWYTFSFSDLDVLQDVARISLIQASRQLSTGERQKIQQFFQEIFPFIFHIQCKRVDVQAGGAPPVSLAEDNDSEEYDDARSTLSDMVSDSASADEIRSAATKCGDFEHSARYAAERNTTVTNELLDALRTPNRRIEFQFLCDATFYCFFRAFQLVYERLRRLKQHDSSQRPNSTALKLGLYGDRIPQSESRYNRMLSLVEDLFMEDISHNAFEEQLRVLFTTQAYPLYTIDKIISNLTKSVLAVTTEWRAVDLVRLFLQEPVNDYPRRAKEIVRPDENLFDINVDISARKLTMKIASENSP